MGHSHRLARAVLIIAALAISVIPIMPPPTGYIDDASAFSSDTAMEHIEDLAVAPHPMGSREILRVRHVIIEALSNLGVGHETQSITAPDYYGAPGRTVEVVNVLARVDGYDSSGAIAVVGHYDTVDSTSGANDNSSAVAILLEVARSLVDGPSLQNDVILLFSDGEEPSPKFGAQAFVDSHPWFDDVAFVINLEAIGSAGPSIVSTANGPERWLIDHYAAAAPRPAAFSFATTIADLIGGSNTDLAPFRDAGVPGVEFVYMRGSSIYHTDRDNVDNVGRLSVEQHGANTLAMVRHLGMEDLSDVPGEQEAVFFTVGPSWVVRHGTWVSIYAAALTGFMVLMLAYRGWREASVGFGAEWIRLLTTMLVFGLVWVPLASWRSDMGIAEGYAYLAGLVGVAVVIDRVILPRHRHPIGAVAVWWVLGTGLLGLAGLGYLFVWPALVAAAVLLRRRTAIRVRPWEQWASTAAVWITTLVLLVPAIETMFQFAHPRPGNPDSQILPTVVVPALLVALAVNLLRAVRVEPVSAPEVVEPHPERVVSLS